MNGKAVNKKRYSFCNVTHFQGIVDCRGECGQPSTIIIIIYHIIFALFFKLTEERKKAGCKPFFLEKGRKPELFGSERHAYEFVSIVSSLDLHTLICF